MANEDWHPTPADIDRLAFNPELIEGLRKSAEVWSDPQKTIGIDPQLASEQADAQREFAATLSAWRTDRVKSILP